MYDIIFFLFHLFPDLEKKDIESKSESELESLIELESELESESESESNECSSEEILFSHHLKINHRILIVFLF